MTRRLARFGKGTVTPGGSLPSGRRNHPTMTRLVLTVLVFCLSASAAAADQAVLPGGRLVEGKLRCDRGGRLTFVSTDRRALAAAEVRGYRLATAVPYFRGTPAHLVRLAGDEQLSGVFASMDADRLRLRTAWSERLTIPRRGVVALTHLPGWRTVRHAALSSRPADTAISGGPDFGPRGVQLRRAGQEVSWQIHRPLSEGRVGIDWREEPGTTGARWVVETRFATSAGDRWLRVVLAGAGTTLVVEGSLPGTTRVVERIAASRRLTVTFSSVGVRLLADDAVLWHTPVEASGGALRQVRLACLEAPAETKAAGAVSFTDWTLETAAVWPQRPTGEPGQDELWLASGDQLFGRVAAADSAGVELHTGQVRRRLPWSDLLGWYPRREAAVPPAEAPTVRLELHSGLRPGCDILDGRLLHLDDRAAEIVHPQLGTLTIPRMYVAALLEMPR